LIINYSTSKIVNYSSSSWRSSRIHCTAMIIDYTTIYRTRVGDRSADVVIDGARVCDGADVGDCTTWRVGDVIVVGDGSRVGDGATRVD